jgi:hypothetical protein
MSIEATARVSNVARRIEPIQADPMFGDDAPIDKSPLSGQGGGAIAVTVQSWMTCNVMHCANKHQKRRNRHQENYHNGKDFYYHLPAINPVGLL